MRRIFLTALFALVSVCAVAMEPELLFKAASTGHMPGIERWLRSGGSPNIVDAKGNSALLLASENGWYDAASLLIEKGAVVDMKNSRGYTPLFYAVLNRHPAMLRLLLDSGADPNAENNSGETPEQYVQAEGFENILLYMEYLNGSSLIAALGPNSFAHMSAWQKSYFTYLAEKRASRAEEVLQNAAKTDPDAMYFLAVRIAEKEPERSLELMKAAAAGGSIDAMYHAGVYFSEGETPIDPVLGFNYLKTAADAFDLNSMARTGSYYLLGLGVKADTGMALKYLEPAARWGSADALYYMGYMRLYGIGLPLDTSSGMKNITDAAAAGSEDAKRHLRQMRTEAALTFLKTYPEKSRSEIRAYMLSLGAVPFSGVGLCDSYDVSGLFDRAYGVRAVTICYPEAHQPQMTFVLHAETYPVFRERLINYAGHVPVEFVTENK